MVVIEPKTADLKRDASIAQVLVKDLSFRSSLWGIVRFVVTKTGLFSADKPGKKMT